MTVEKSTKIRLVATISVFLFGVTKINASEDRYPFGGSISGQNKIILETLIGKRVYLSKIEAMLEPMLSEHRELCIRFKDARVWTAKTSLVPPDVKTALDPDQPLTLSFDQLAVQMSSLKQVILANQNKDELISSIQNALGEYTPEGILYKVVSIADVAKTCLSKVCGISGGNTEDFESKGVGVFVFKQFHETTLAFNQNVRDTLGSLIELMQSNTDPLVSSDILSVIIHMSKKVDELYSYFGH
jgi:hypothetical protein